MKNRTLSTVTLIIATLVWGFQDASASEITLTRIWLYTSGVSLFEYEGVVNGDDEFRLSVRPEEMADTIRTMTVADLDGGQVTIARYDAAESLAQRLQRYPIDVSSNLSYVALLRQLRGQELTLTTADGEVIAGSLSTIEERSDGDDYAVGVLSATGFRLISGSAIHQLHLADRALEEEILAALSVLSDAKNDRERELRIEFSGTGERRVRVQFIRVVPVWKTSYRLAAKTDSALLQGWAHVDNATTTDWIDVELNLVAGNPSSFYMDLYTSIFRDRPRIAYETGPNVVAPAYDGVAPRRAPSPGAMSSAPAPSEALSGMRDNAYADGIAFGGGVQAQTATTDTASFALYRMREPVTLNRGTSAMIPIVSEDVSARRISVFDAAVLATRPLSGVTFTNDTGSLLPAGPVMILDRNTYGGDSRVSSIPAGEERMVTYAVDQKSRVRTESDLEPEEIVFIRIVDGVLEVQRRRQKTTVYSIESAPDAEGSLLIVHPRASGWELVSPNPSETTDSSYRFTHAISGNTTGIVPVVEQQRRDERSAVLNMNDSQIGVYISQRLISPAVRRALENIRDLRRRLDTTRNTRVTLENEEATIYRDQERIRGNMGALDRDSSLYRRYASTLSAQEDRLEELGPEIERARTAETTAQNALSEYVRELTVR